MSNGKSLEVARKDIKNTLMSPGMAKQIALALPKIGVDPKRIAAVAYLSISRDSKLLQCTPSSLVRSVVLSAQYGLLPDGRQAHLIPYSRECQFQMDYKGLITLIRRSPKVAAYFLDAVYENDEFEIISGSERKITHKPCLRGARGDLLCVYSLITYENGQIDFDYMTVPDVEKTRDNYAQKNQQGQFSKAWRLSFDEQAKKTVCHRHGKKADISSETALAIQADAIAETGTTHEDQMKDMIEGDFILEEADPIQDIETFKAEFEAAVKKSKRKYGSMKTVYEYAEKAAKHFDMAETTFLQGATNEIDEFFNAYEKWTAKLALETVVTPPREEKIPDSISEPQESSPADNEGPKKTSGSVGLAIYEEVKAFFNGEESVAHDFIVDAVKPKIIRGTAELTKADVKIIRAEMEKMTPPVEEITSS